MTKRHRSALPLIVLVALVGTACGSDDSASQPESSASRPASTPTPTETAQAVRKSGKKNPTATFDAYIAARKAGDPRGCGLFTDSGRARYAEINETQTCEEAFEEGSSDSNLAKISKTQLVAVEDHGDTSVVHFTTEGYAEHFNMVRESGAWYIDEFVQDGYSDDG